MDTEYIALTILQTLLLTDHSYIDEGSLSSERLQYSADPVQRSTISSSAGGDSQVHTQRGKVINTAGSDA